MSEQIRKQIAYCQQETHIAKILVRRFDICSFDTLSSDEVNSEENGTKETSLFQQQTDSLRDTEIPKVNVPKWFLG